MKQLLYTAFILFLASCKQKEGAPFTIDGTIKNSPAKTVYLEKNAPGSAPLIMDSSALKGDGSFEVKANTKEQSLFTLRFSGEMYPFALLINDARKVTLSADLKNPGQRYTVNGSPATDKMLEFDKAMGDKTAAIYNEGRLVDSFVKVNASDSLKNAQYGRFEAATADLKGYAQQFIQNSNNPVLVLYAFSMYENASRQMGFSGFTNSEAASLLAGAVKKFPDNTTLVSLQKQYLPKPAPDFTLPDTSGTAVSLSSFRGKYVLLDFWASWCGPCRRENPNVVQAYNQFKDKNFTILGVSLDKNKEAWLKAIKDDKLTWNHVSDLQEWNSAAAALYHVNGIPYNFLIDPQGNIIAENIRGEELQQKLREVIR